MGEEADFSKKNKNFIELIAFDKNENIQYVGTCKIVINRLSKVLFIEPHNEDHKLISASFKWKYAYKKNILFVLAEHSSQDFALVFNNEARCKRVYNILCESKESNVPEDSMICNRILFPMFKAAAKNNSNHKLQNLLIQWINNHKGNAKKELLKTLKDQNICDDKIYKCFDLGGTHAQQNKSVLKKFDSRKRRHSQFDSNKDGGSEKAKLKKHKSSQEKSYTKCLTEYKHVFILKPYTPTKRLIVFTSAEKSSYYVYFWNFAKKLYLCSGCRLKYKQTTATMEKDGEGNEILKLENVRHCCEPKKYDPADIRDIKKLQKPDYKIFENGSQKLLIIFCEGDKSKCYEYFNHKSVQGFYCKGCTAVNKTISAKLCYAGDSKEYVEVYNDNHICEPRKYEPEKCSKINEFVLKPNFEIRTKTENGVEKKVLIVLDRNDKNLCHVYHYSYKEKHWMCIRCKGQHHKYVTAKLNKNEDGEEYVTLSLTKHLCALREYIPDISGTNNIIKLPNFVYMEKTSTTKPKLFIFDDNDRSKCYTFSKIGGINPRNRFYCLGCHKIANGKNVKLLNGKKVKGIVNIQLCQDDDEGNHYIRLEEHQKHLCKPSKYQPEYYQTKEITTFFLYKTPHRSLCAAIYHPNDSNLCYTFSYSSSEKYFDCHGCQKKYKHARARLRKDGDGNEYFTHNFKNHVCKPTKVSTLKQSGIEILEKSGLTFESKKKEVDESKIIREPNFEIHQRKNGVPNGKLIILHPDDSNLCYEYWKQGHQYFKCSKCRIATAKLISNENGERFITLGKNEHQCKPVKYQKEEHNILKSPNFKIFNRDFDDKPKILVIFTSPTQELCYEMQYYKTPKSFLCSACKMLRQRTAAVLCRDKHGTEECIQLLKEHICKPLKFDRKNYLPKVILKSSFELQSNEKNESKLIIFANGKKDMGYEYYLLKDNIYKCISCEEKKRTTVAELCEENGKTCLKLSNYQHACKPKKVTQNVSENDAFLNTITSIEDDNVTYSSPTDSLLQSSDTSNEAVKKSYKFKLFEYYKSEKLCRKLFVFVEDDKNDANGMCHIYLKTDSQGKEYVDLTNDIHTCAPRKFDPEKFKERQKLYKPDYKVIEGMHEDVKKRKLIIFNPTNKDFCYEYYQNGSSYRCAGCHSKNKFTAAQIYYYRTEKEYVEVYDGKHVCKLRPYNSVVILTKQEV